MNSSTFSSSSQCLLFIIFIIIFFNSATATRFNIPRLSPTGGTILQELAGIVFQSHHLEHYKTFYYNQTLDHFNYRPESYSTFRQRYVINFKYWGGANASAPIFAYLGAEAPLNEGVPASGFLTDNAVRFNALLVSIEHRYYGKSIPFGSREEALKNASTLGYFNSAQAIADYAEILIHVKKKYQAEDSPVIVVGGSYGGMLASWFRLKYPHVALGALASSAPILYFDNIKSKYGYFSIVTKDFREASETCYQTIRDSWSEIDKAASQLDGLSTLSKKFKTCNPLKRASELKNYLKSIYASAAQYNRPPRYPVTVVCGGIDGEATGSDILSKIFAGVVAYYGGNRSCYVNAPTNLSETTVGWSWQKCSEMVIPIGIDENNTMFERDPFVLSDFINECREYYGVSPRPHWVTTYYGGHDIKLILRRFGSNIIFSNGLRDPYSSGGVLENISDSIVAVYTINGSHCLDILLANKSSDPDWLVKQRKIEVEIIEEWIANYYADLKALKI
ncbi:hypothetical protein LWI28_016804 [Acer negundo]|uniref:Lysosomal Pro-X carboxypeptidase n=1 Tax=Acer negundo TaxID=4023 RepID=A0AAD5JEJ9_ACENE|nr:hypothetical protein LWI28_016804 [Acer negundo]KAK4855950.1 hypothetical protein QYF36_012644 [Acer negundo]